MSTRPRPGERLDALMTLRGMTNADAANAVGCSTNYVSGIRNGQRPGLKLASALCSLFPGELTLSDFGIEIDPSVVKAAGEAA